MPQPPVSDSELSDSDSIMESPYEVEVCFDAVKRVFGRPPDIRDMNIITRETFTVPKVTGPCRFPYHGSRGDTLLEVFSVRINEISNECQFLYGSFTVDDGGLVHCLFAREKPDHDDANGAESLDPEMTGELQLIGPNTNSISADYMPSFELTLRNEKSARPSHCSFGWAMFRNDLHNVPLAAVFDGEFGSVTVNYSLFTQPLAAKVEIVLLDDATHISSSRINNQDGDDQQECKRPKLMKSANVCGRISAQNSFFENDLDESVLFHRKMKSWSCVNYGESIPLSRSIVSFPYPASLIVKVDLWERNTAIARGRVEFKELNPGCTSVSSSISGTIQVNVTCGYIICGGKAL